MTCFTGHEAWLRHAALLPQRTSSLTLEGVSAPRTGFAGCAPLTRFAGA